MSVPQKLLTSLSRDLELAPAATASAFLHTIPSRQTFQEKVMIFFTDAYIRERAKWKEEDGFVCFSVLGHAACV